MPRLRFARARVLSVGIAVALLGPSGLAHGAPPEPPSGDLEGDLSRAVEQFWNLDDEGATAALNKILERKPAGSMAARVHLYLGLIQLNALHTDDARAQFEQALVIDPTVELPPQAPPKAKTVFGQVRQKIDAAAQAATAPGQAISPTSATAPAAPVIASTRESAAAQTTPEAEPNHSHWPTLAFGGAAAVAAGFAIGGGIDVLNYTSMVNSAKSHPSNYNASQFESAQPGAQTWAVGWIVAAVVAAVCTTGAVLTW